METIILLLKTVLLILFMMPVDLLFTLLSWTWDRQGKSREAGGKTRGIWNWARSLPAGIAAIAAWACYIHSSRLTQGTQPWHSSNNTAFWRLDSHMQAAQSSPWPSGQLVTCKCNAISDLSCGTVITYKTWVRESDHAILVNFSLSQEPKRRENLKVTEQKDY